jgi:hypothetical protein
MKDSGKSAKALLDVPYDPAAEALLDELERSGQFRIGLDAELDEDGIESTGTDYSFGRGSGSVIIQDWWTAGRVDLHISAGLLPEDLTLARFNDSLELRTHDGLDRVMLDGYLGLIPDASTLRVQFADGTEWTGQDLISRISSWLAEAPAA